MFEASVIVSGGVNTGALRATLEAVLRDPYAQRMEIVVVTEAGVPIDASALNEIESTPHVLKIVSNQFAPGPSGSRRTGILASTASVIAFYDDIASRSHGHRRTALVNNT